jgi:hypothetical protein
MDCTRDVEMRTPDRRLTQCRAIAYAANMHSAEQRVFIVREYWRTGSFIQCQLAFRNKYGEESVPTKSCIHILVNKLKTTGSVLTRYAGGRKMCDRMEQAPPRKILKKAFARNLHFLFHMTKSCQERETAPISCVHSQRTAANGNGDTCTILSIVPKFSWGTSGYFGHHMFREEA